MLAKTWLNESKYQRFASNISKRDEYLPKVKEVSEVKTKIDSNASISWKEYQLSLSKSIMRNFVRKLNIT